MAAKLWVFLIPVCKKSVAKWPTRLRSMLGGRTTSSRCLRWTGRMELSTMLLMLMSGLSSTGPLSFGTSGFLCYTCKKPWTAPSTSWPRRAARGGPWSAGPPRQRSPLREGLNDSAFLRQVSRLTLAGRWACFLIHTLLLPMKSKKLCADSGGRRLVKFCVELFPPHPMWGLPSPRMMTVSCHASTPLAGSLKGRPACLLLDPSSSTVMPNVGET